MSSAAPPVIIATGGPPAAPALVALAAWEVLWLLIGVAALNGTAADLRRSDSTVSAA